MADTPGVAAGLLLERCIAYLETVGFDRSSLREIAAGAGTSHRMLIYHFGSREGLLQAVVDHVESQQRDALAGLVAAPDADLLAISQAFWERISDPSLAPAERLFFEIYGAALHSPDWAPSFRRSVIEAWEAPLRDMFHAHGFATEDAAVRARLVLATARGLLLDLLLTDDRAAIDASGDLFMRLVTAL